MEIPASVYTQNIDRRELQAWEMALGGQGQRYLSGSSNNAPSGYAYYAVSFLSDSVVNSVGYYGQYNMNNASYAGVAFPGGFTWTVPITSINLSAGNAIGYLYKLRFTGCTVGCATTTNDVTL